MDISKLKWNRVDDGFHDFDGEMDFDDGTFYGLEEIEDVSVVKQGNTVKFVPKDQATETTTLEPTKPKAKPKIKTKSKNKTSTRDTKSSKDESLPLEDDNTFGALAKAEVEPAYSLGSWTSGLDWRLYTALKKLDFLSPTPIQQQSIPPILEGKDVIGKAATGSGKTLAYSIPLLNRFYNNPEICDSRPEGLIVSPTRELAHQIKDHLQAVCWPEFKHRIVSVTGGLAIQKQLRQISRKPIIVIATPGRLFELLENMPPAEQKQWQTIPSLVLDEADRLIQSGSFKELEQILAIIGVSKQRQVLVYSATFNTELWSSLKSTSNRKRKHDDIKDIMHDKIGLNKLAEFIDADPESQVASDIHQAVVEAPAMEKDLYLYYFLSVYPGKSIVFVNSIDAVKRIVPLLKELKMNAIGVHSDMIQKQRLRSIERFKKLDNSILIATDVAARGLDVPQVDHVIHYHLPRTADMYVHRSGRTARAGNLGVSVSLCSPQEKSGPLPKLVKLIKSKPANLDVDYDLIEQLRERVALAKQIADSNQTATKKGKTDAWLQKAADDLGVDIDDVDVDMFGGGKQKKGKSKPEKEVDVRGLREELNALLSQKLGNNRRYLTSGSINWAHELLSKPQNLVVGKPMKSALDELKPRKKKRTN